MKRKTNNKVHNENNSATYNIREMVIPSPTLRRIPLALHYWPSRLHWIVRMSHTTLCVRMTVRIPMSVHVQDFNLGLARSVHGNLKEWVAPIQRAAVVKDLTRSTHCKLCGVEVLIYGEYSLEKREG